MASEERAYAINPLVQEAIQHNVKVLSELRNLTSSLFGIAAGILGLEAYVGFIFYLAGTCLVSALVWLFLAGGKPGRYFGGLNTDLTAPTDGNKKKGTKQGKDDEANEDAHEEGDDKKGGSSVGNGGSWQLWTEGVMGGLSSFVLTWTLFYGLVRA